VQEKTEKRIRKSRQTKDRVLQARIPEQLDDELRDRAEQLGLSVSTIVRNVLLNTFDLVEGVVMDSSQIARALAGKNTTPPEPEVDVGVVGWQEAILNRNGVCEECNAILPMGQRAAIGVPAGPRPALLCMDCLAALHVVSAAEFSENPSASKPKKRATTKSSSAQENKAGK